jgi:hypothetical protein
MSTKCSGHVGTDVFRFLTLVFDRLHGRRPERRSYLVFLPSVRRVCDPSKTFQACSNYRNGGGGRQSRSSAIFDDFHQRGQVGVTAPVPQAAGCRV